MAIINRKWEEYDGAPKDRHQGRMHITLNSRGTLRINRVALEKLGDPEKVKLLFDHANKAIGIRPAVETDRHPYTLRTYRNGSHREVQINGFLRHYNAATTRTIRYLNPEIDNWGVLVLDMNQVEPVAAPKRRKKEDDAD
jgi:hypothetical protein